MAGSGASPIRDVTTATRSAEGVPPPGGRPAGAPGREWIALLPAVPVLVAWVAWGPADGGYFARTWYPCAIAAVVLLVVVAIAGGRVLPDRAPLRLAICLFAGFVAWTYLSVLWSDSPGDGLEAGNELLLSLTVAWILALLPWSTRGAWVLLGLWVLGTAAVCAGSLISATSADRIGGYFLEGRYMDPVGYSNGVSALAAIALWPALALAYGRWAPPALRPLFLAAAVFLLEFSLLPQSRGSIIGLAITAPPFVLLAPDRLRLVPIGLVIAAAVLLSIGPVYDVYDVGTAINQGTTTQPLEPVLDDAARAIWLTALLAGAAGVALVLLDRAVRPGPAAARRARTAVIAALALLALGGAVIAIANAGDIADTASERWDTFKSGKDTPPQPGARLTGDYADQRYDYWRVALEAFRDRPVAGIGAGGYERRYTAERRHEKMARYAHSLWFRVLAEGGLIAAALLLAFLAAGPGRAAWLGRRLEPPGRAVVVAAVCSAAYFFVHSSFDWIEEFPALAVPAFSLPFVALAIAAPPARREARRRRGPLTAAAGWGAAIAVLAAFVVALVPAYLATRYYDRAGRAWTADPAAAFDDLDRAADLNPLSPR